MTCKVCGGPLMELGRLGGAHCFRCRNCGADQMVQTVRRDPDEKSDDDVSEDDDPHVLGA